MLSLPLMRLSELLARAGISASLPAADPEIADVVDDSRRASAGALFVAIRGASAEGADHALDAVAAGAVAVLAPAGRARPATLAAEVAWLEVPDARIALAEVAAAHHGFPGRSLVLTGVTGSKGKTTTAFLAASVAEAAGEPTALAGTIVLRIGGAEREASLTTASAPALQSFLADAVAASMRGAVIEVSSHALDQSRVHGLRFDSGIFTNLFPDHLDYHETVEEYFQAKRRLFVGEGACARAAIQIDGRHGIRLAAEHPRAITFGASAEADVRPLSIEAGRSGTRVLAAVPGGRQVLLDSPLIGRYNAANLLAVAAWAVARELPLDAVREGVRALASVPGRLEPVELGQPFSCLVDYAHMGPALEAALAAVREWTSGRVLVVFGAGGNRPRERRRTLGEAAAKLADYSFITTDNPRDEDPQTIASEIVAAFRVAGGSGGELVLDRRDAIHAAIRMAQPGDTVLVAGKGHERYQLTAGVKHPFDDRVVVAEALRARGFGA